MLERLVALVVDEGKWLPVSIALAALAAVWRLRGGDDGPPLRRRIEAALTLFFAVMIGMMAFGHLAAVTTKLALGTLDGSRLKFYGIGAALAAPSWWLAVHSAGGTLPTTAAHATTAVRLTIWLAVTLLAMGPQNLPLAAPGLFGQRSDLRAVPRHRLTATGADARPATTPRRAASRTRCRRRGRAAANPATAGS